MPNKQNTNMVFICIKQRLHNDWPSNVISNYFVLKKIDQFYFVTQQTYNVIMFVVCFLSLACQFAKLLWTGDAKLNYYTLKALPAACEKAMSRCQHAIVIGNNG